MACNFVLTINNDKSDEYGKAGIILGPAESADSTYTIEQLYTDLSRMSKYKLNDLITHLLNAMATFTPNSEFKPLKDYKSRVAIHAFTTHLALLGVKVVEQAMPEGVLAYTENGIIYLNKDMNCTTAALHELMHLVLGVMRTTDFNQYQKLLSIVESSTPFQTLYAEICKDSTYEKMMQLDKKEEAFCRMLEELMDENINVHNFKIDDIDYDRINKILNPFISETFGIEKVPDLLNFLNSTVSELPVYGSTLFIRPKLETTGYSEHLKDVILAGRITNRIKELVELGNIKLKGDCL